MTRFASVHTSEEHDHHERVQSGLHSAAATPTADAATIARAHKPILFWSKRGAVACAEHAPDANGALWSLEQWARIPVDAGHGRVAYQCQYCDTSARPIGHVVAAPRPHAQNDQPIANGVTVSEWARELETAATCRCAPWAVISAGAAGDSVNCVAQLVNRQTGEHRRLWINCYRFTTPSARLNEILRQLNLR